MKLIEVTPAPAPLSEHGKEVAETKATLTNLLAPKEAAPVVITSDKLSQKGLEAEETKELLLNMLKR